MSILDTVQGISDKLDRIAEVILGDPTDMDKPGVMIRLDRLERADKSKARVIWILATGVTIAAGNALLSIM